MIARSFKSVIWVATVGAAALSCYMVSLRVATERADLAKVERQIIAAKRDIRSLQTELGTRGRMTQLEDWNANVLALSAPTAAQFVKDDVMLARLEKAQPTVDQRSAEVRMASADAGGALPSPQVQGAAEEPKPLPHVVPAIAHPAPTQPALHQASYTPPARPSLQPERKPAPAVPVKKPEAKPKPERQASQQAKAPHRAAAAAKPELLAKAEPKPAAKPERHAKAEAKPAAKPERHAKADTKAAAKPERHAKSEAKPAAKHAAAAKPSQEKKLAAAIRAPRHPGQESDSD